MPTKRLSITVTGRVQGVGYRYFVQDTANSAGIFGWVRNNPDRTVECEVQGEDEVLQEFLERLRTGPVLSRVKNVFVFEMPVDHAQAHYFEITG